LDKIKRFAIGVAATGVFLSSAAGALAAPGDNGGGYGGCVDNFYGNATNERPSGHGVLPSQSPGPWVNNPSDPDNPFWGPSMGDVMKITTSAGLNGKQTMDIVCTFP
jgi:hypothetical protein